jgi:hydroxymethylpyrimidine/phosphomethylpyrimidine kinase
VVCAVLTVQSTRGLAAVEPVAPRLVARQLAELLADLDIGAYKTGALGTVANARVVARALRDKPGALVVDPVLGPSRGSRRLNDVEGIALLLPRATLLTPNVPEAEVLLGARIRSAREGAHAARALAARCGCAVLLKGGHLDEDNGRVSDWLASGDVVRRFSRPRARPSDVHGTGCALASFIAGALALEAASRRHRHPVLVAVVKRARRAHARWRAEAQVVGRGMHVMAPRR